MRASGTHLLEEFVETGVFMQVFAPVGLLEGPARHGVRNLDGEGESLAKPDLRIKKIDRLGTRDSEFAKYSLCVRLEPRLRACPDRRRLHASTSPRFLTERVPRQGNKVKKIRLLSLLLWP